MERPTMLIEYAAFVACLAVAGFVFGFGIAIIASQSRPGYLLPPAILMALIFTVVAIAVAVIHWVAS
jgi:hypothetical protein